MNPSAQPMPASTPESGGISSKARQEQAAMAAGRLRSSAMCPKTVARKDAAMTLLRRLVLPCFALAAGASLAAPPPAPGVYVMRHLQKDAGDDPGLSTEGRANAERLAGWFGTDAPRAIYVSSTRRARETAAPLARKLHIEPKEYAPADVAGLVARVRQESGTVLIVGHSNT